MGILGIMLRLREAAQDARFEAAARDPERAQATVLRALLSRNAETCFGREHGFSRIAGPADYRSAVPMREYEAFRPYVRRIMAGEGSVLTRAPVAMFSTTSGSAGEPKLIPVTEDWKEEQAKLTRLWMLRAMRDHPGCYDRKVLVASSPAVEGRTERGVPYGSMSGMAARRIPWVVRRNFAIPYAVCLIKDYDARYAATMRYGLAGSVSLVGTPNPSTLVRLAETASRRAEEIIRGVRDGTLGIADPELADHLSSAERARARDELHASLRRDPERAAELEAVVRAHGSLLPGACWPELRLVGCWLGGSAGVQAKALAALFGDVPRRDLGLIASEGRMTVPIEDETAAGCLLLHRCFYEFIDEDRIEDTSPPIRLAHELADGRRYYIVPTGGNGLYRYDLNDVVEVRGFHHRAPKVAFVRKGRDMVNITGEKLHVNQIQSALQEAGAACRVDVWQFRMIPDIASSRYDVLVEVREATPASDRRFIEAFDLALRGLNPEYAQKRASGRLGRPRLFVMRPGWSETLCRAEFAGGRRDLQFKWRALADEWDEGSRGAVARSVEELE